MLELGRDSQVHLYSTYILFLPSNNIFGHAINAPTYKKQMETSGIIDFTTLFHFITFAIHFCMFPFEDAIMGIFLVTFYSHTPPNLPTEQTFFYKIIKKLIGKS